MRALLIEDAKDLAALAELEGEPTTALGAFVSDLRDVNRRRAPPQTAARR